LFEKTPFELNNPIKPNPIAAVAKSKKAEKDNVRV
jgi:hypothetical protein